MLNSNNSNNNKNVPWWLPLNTGIAGWRAGAPIYIFKNSYWNIFTNTYIYVIYVYMYIYIWNTLVCVHSNNHARHAVSLLQFQSPKLAELYTQWLSSTSLSAIPAIHFPFPSQPQSLTCAAFMKCIKFLCKCVWLPHICWYGFKNVLGSCIALHDCQDSWLTVVFTAHLR